MIMQWWRRFTYKQKYTILTGSASITILGGSVWWSVWSTVNSIKRVVAGGALDRERRGAPEFIYYNDPAIELRIKEDQEQDRDSWFLWPYIGRRISRWRRTVWRRYLHVCCEGEFHERIQAVNHLKKISHLEEWESAWVSQRLDARAAVNLARSGAGKNRKLLQTPPLPPQCRELSITVPLEELTKEYPNHACLSTYLQQHNDKLQDIQRHMEQDVGGSGGSSESSRINNDEVLLQSLLEVIHHIDVTTKHKDDDKPEPSEVFANAGGLVFVQQAANSPRRDLQVVAARILLKFSSLPKLLNTIHRTGLLANLSKWFDGDDAELKCIAAGALAGMELESENPQHIYTPAVQLLHPVHRTVSPPSLDVITVHGLLGEPFVTWRQRDRIANHEQKNSNSGFLDGLNDTDDFEMVLRDIPESALRDPVFKSFYQRNINGLAQLEQKELSEYTRCWPRDWLPNDCPNIRVLGVSYDSVMTEWGEPCEEGAKKRDGLVSRSNRLSAALREAGVGTRPIVWITHSMGGLIVKQILVDSLESKTDEEHDIAKQTKGIIFFSTPHHGSRAAHVLLWPSKEVQAVREDNCAALGELHKRWLAGNWPCVCVAEGKPTKLLSIPGINPSLYLVVPSSADAGVGPFYQLPLDHMDTCKPSTRHSFIYRIVVDMVRHAKGDICTLEECTHCAQKKIEDNSQSNRYKNWVFNYFRKTQYNLDVKGVNKN